MSDQQTTDTTAPAGATTEQPGTEPAGAQTSAAAQEVTFTPEQQAHINRIVGNARAQGRAERPATPAPRLAPTNGAKAGEQDLQAQIAELQKSHTDLQQRLDYTSRVGKLGMPDSPALFKVFQADPQGFEETVSMLGLKSPQQSATPNGTTVDPAKSGAAAPSAPSGPVNGNNHGGVPDLWSLSVAQIDAMGPAGVRAEYEKIMAVGNARAGAPPRPRVAQRK
jgi:hypothetical protein